MSVRRRVLVGTCATSAVLASLSAISIHFYVDRAMNVSIDNALRTRADEVVTRARRAGARTAVAEPRVGRRLEGITQILDPSGRRLASTKSFEDVELLAGADLRRAHSVPTFTIAHAGVEHDERVRVLALPVRDAGEVRYVAVVATTMERRDEVLEVLRNALLAGTPVLVLLIALATMRQLALPLRAIDAIQRRAGRIGHEQLDERIPVPEADDEIARLATTLNGMLDRLQHSIERERSFIANASHELRTPLSLLRGELELVATALHERDRARDESAAQVGDTQLTASIDEALSEVDRLALLTNSLLLLAEHGEQRLRVHREPAQIPQLARTVAERFHTRAQGEQRSITVETVEKGDVTTARVDRLLVEQAIANLVDNSLRYGTGTVAIRVVGTPTGVDVTVVDRGSGIPDELADTAFDRFTRGSRRDTPTGAGIGLSIVSLVAAAHGGEVRLVDHKDARFVALSLPTVGG